MAPITTMTPRPYAKYTWYLGTPLPSRARKLHHKSRAMHKKSNYEEPRMLE